MQVILKKTISTLGLVGDVVNVAAGYYRNFLAPRNLAFLADAGSVKAAAHQKQVIASRKEKEKAVSLEIKKRLEASPLTLEHQAGEGEKLYGSITSKEIALRIREGGFDIDRRQLRLENPIKTLGEHEVEIKLHPEVSAKLKVQVTRKEKIAEVKTEKSAEPKAEAKAAADV